eukprot:6187633-Pleurochrysis_carterae.AAC.4
MIAASVPLAHAPQALIVKAASGLADTSTLRGAAKREPVRFYATEMCQTCEAEVLCVLISGEELSLEIKEIIARYI